MPHPIGGLGTRMTLPCSFQQAHAHVGTNGAPFRSSTGEVMAARQGYARDGRTPLIVLVGERGVHGRVCPACWGCQRSCSGSRVGHAATV